MSTRYSDTKEARAKYEATTYASRRARDPINVRMIQSKAQAKVRRIEFDLTLDYLKSIYPVDGACPIFGIRMVLPTVGVKQHANTATIDRIDSSVGYVEGNVWWISWRANNLKRDATVEELETLAQALRRHSK